jgi:hypothetical protein
LYVVARYNIQHRLLTLEGRSVLAAKSSDRNGPPSGVQLNGRRPAIGKRQGLGVALKGGGKHRAWWMILEDHGWNFRTSRKPAPLL